MSVGRAHLVDISQGNALDHILDVRADGTKTRNVLARTKPNAGSQDGGGGELELDGCVREGAGEGATRPADGDSAGREGDGDSRGDFDLFGRRNDFHGDGWMDARKSG